ncbi:MAG: FhaA domain-containing protein, partial [Candidatus Limnocylindria bacterium]
AIERFFERLLERPSARLFRARLQPIQLQRRIERAMEAERLSAADRTLVPNRFVVHLHPADLAGFGDMTASLASELADGALVFARSHRYTLVDRPRVDLIADPTVDRAEIRVVARFADALSVSAASTGRDGTPPPRVAGSVTGADRSGPTDTVVYTIPRPSAPPARLRVTTPKGAERTVEFDGTGLTIGRAPDNDLVLDDGRVSRHHARLAGRRGTLVYVDLASTNGSRVNGVAVGELVLGVGDRIELGDTVIIVEVAGDVG